MPSVSRDACDTALAQLLWDECARAEASAQHAQSCFEAVLGAVMSARDRLASGPRIDYAGPSRASVMQANAALARCHRRGITDEARRRAVDRASELGALRPGFDEASLPWSDPVVRGRFVRLSPEERFSHVLEALGTKAAEPSVGYGDPLRAPLLVTAAGSDFPSRSAAHHALVVVARLSRLAERWDDFEDEIAGVVRALDAVSGPPQILYYPSGRPFFMNGDAFYPDQSGALTRSGAWRYPGSAKPARENVWLFYPPPHDTIAFDASHRDFPRQAADIVEAAARVDPRLEHASLRSTLAGLDDELRLLALLELACLVRGSR